MEEFDYKEDCLRETRDPLESESDSMVEEFADNDSKLEYCSNCKVSTIIDVAQQPKKYEIRNCPICKIQLQYRCRRCKKFYKWFGSLNFHVSQICGKEPSYRCNNCTFMTNSKGGLTVHMRSKHTAEMTPHKCSKCPKMYKHRTHMLRHQRQCIGMIYECNVCDYKSLTKYFYELHLIGKKSNDSKGHVKEELHIEWDDENQQSSDGEEYELIVEEPSNESDSSVENEFRAMVEEALDASGKIVYCTKCKVWTSLKKPLKKAWEKRCIICDTRLIYKCRLCNRMYNTYHFFLIHKSREKNPNDSESYAKEKLENERNSEIQSTLPDLTRKNSPEVKEHQTEKEPSNQDELDEEGKLSYCCQCRVYIIVQEPLTLSRKSNCPTCHTELKYKCRGCRRNYMTYKFFFIHKTSKNCCEKNSKKISIRYDCCYCQKRCNSMRNLSKHKDKCTKSPTNVKICPFCDMKPLAKDFNWHLAMNHYSILKQENIMIISQYSTFIMNNQSILNIKPISEMKLATLLSMQADAFKSITLSKPIGCKEHRHMSVDSHCQVKEELDIDWSDGESQFKTLDSTDQSDDKYEYHTFCSPCNTISTIRYHIKCNEIHRCTTCNAILYYKCSRCQPARIYKCIASLRQHMRYVCQKPANFACDACDFKSWYKGALKVHIENHHMASMKRRHKCSKCPKSYVYKHDLARHKKQCGGKRVKMPCDYCGYATVDVDRLKQHLRKAHGLNNVPIIHT
ncbi:hypothetical protein TSAR_011828 [Trichomalopsis sarcophagae]|uniref:C2H2-type domain-containing protein n=1 Tax=Trichomalopsis sarcophagae TaxID=543379 RepID=A0A232F621_9HYME|nr:hypothetical protein TSAR_011828 [Trichomalopsis sarcophagae]